MPVARQPAEQATHEPVTEHPAALAADGANEYPLSAVLLPRLHSYSPSNGRAAPAGGAGERVCSPLAP